MVAHYAGSVFETTFCLSFDVTSYLNNTKCLLCQIYNSLYLYLVGFPFRFFAEQGNNLCSFPPVAALRRILIFLGCILRRLLFSAVSDFFLSCVLLQLTASCYFTQDCLFMLSFVVRPLTILSLARF